MGKYIHFDCFLSIILVCSNKRHVSYRLTSPLSIGHQTKLKYTDGYLKICSHIQTYDLSDWLSNRHLSSLNSHTCRNPSNEKCNPISINKHLLGSLTQQQTYSDIQLCCNGVQALCSQTTEECKKQKQEMRIIMKLRKIEALCINSPWKTIQSSAHKIQNIHKEKTVW